MANLYNERQRGLQENMYAPQQNVGMYTIASNGGGQSLQAAPGSQAHVTTYTAKDGSRQKGTSYWDTMQADLDTAYQAQRDQNAEALAAAQERARAAEAAQQEALARQYQGTNRQLYRDYMQQQRNLPQQMAAQGYTGGLTESSRLRLGNAYGEALNTNEQARIGQSAEYAQALEQELYEAQAAAAAADNDALQRYYEQRNALRAQRQQQERADLEQRAAAMAAVGDFSLYRKLGYTEAQIRKLRRAWERQNRKGSGGRGGRGGGGTVPRDTKGKGGNTSAGASGSDETKADWRDTPAYQEYLKRQREAEERQRRQTDRVR